MTWISYALMSRARPKSATQGSKISIRQTVTGLHIPVQDDVGYETMVKEVETSCRPHGNLESFAPIQNLNCTVPKPQVKLYIFSLLPPVQLL